MPARQTPFVKDFVYHIFNRGVDKREIFTDDPDYKNFLNILKHFTSKDVKNRPGLPKVSILAYCLMPNHFHLLLKEEGNWTVPRFMLRTMTTYVVYFNRKNDRTGSLFENRFKSRLISSDESLLQVSRYIHLNPISIEKSLQSIKKYKWSSYLSYLGLSNDGLSKRGTILSLEPNYDEFVESKALEEFDELKSKFMFSKRRVKPINIGI